MRPIPPGPKSAAKDSFAPLESAPCASSPSPRPAPLFHRLHVACWENARRRAARPILPGPPSAATASSVPPGSAPCASSPSPRLAPLFHRLHVACWESARRSAVRPILPGPQNAVKVSFASWEQAPGASSPFPLPHPLCGVPITKSALKSVARTVPIAPKSAAQASSAPLESASCASTPPILSILPPLLSSLLSQRLTRLLRKHLLPPLTLCPPWPPELGPPLPQFAASMPPWPLPLCLPSRSFSKKHMPVSVEDELKAVIEIGDRFVTIALSSEGSHNMHNNTMQYYPHYKKNALILVLVCMYHRGNHSK